MTNYVRKISKYTKINKTCNNCYMRRKLSYYLKKIDNDYSVDEIMTYLENKIIK